MTITQTEPLTDEALAELLGDAPAPNSGGEAFTPDTPEKADWLLGKIADARARAARVRENAEKIARQHEAEADGLEFRYGPVLQALTRRETEGTRRKSLRLLNGVLGFRQRPAGVQITNPREALCWARQHLPAAVSEALDRKALSDALMATGEAVDFAAFTPAEDVFYVK